MKKLHIIVLLIILVLALAACTEKKKPADTKIEVPETSLETQTKEETQIEVDHTPEKEEVSLENVTKVGYGRNVKLKVKERGENVQTEQNAIFAVVAFDKDGKIVRANIDNAQSRVNVTKEGKFAKPIEEITFKTKRELGDDYGMIKASEIKKEWYEQMDAFEDYIIGKTAEEVTGIPTTKRDDDHENVPSEADLVSSVTIDIGDYQKVVLDAWENSRDVKDVAKIGMKESTKLGNRTSEAKDGKGAQVQFETALTAVVLKEDGTIIDSYLDNAQNTITLNEDGTPATDLSKPGTTKVIRGEDYGMIKASSIGKEWFEQAKALEYWAKGKTEADIKALEIGKDGKFTDVDLLASVTMKPGVYVEGLIDSIELAK